MSSFGVRIRPIEAPRVARPRSKLGGTSCRQVLRPRSLLSLAPDPAAGGRGGRGGGGGFGLGRDKCRSGLDCSLAHRNVSVTSPDLYQIERTYRARDVISPEQSLPPRLGVTHL